MDPKLQYANGQMPQGGYVNGAYQPGAQPQMMMQGAGGAPYNSQMAPQGYYAAPQPAIAHNTNVQVVVSGGTDTQAHSFFMVKFNFFVSLRESRVYLMSR